ncbi:hypothetical protein MCERE10_02567 [Burkholderiaceae bacterium]
MNKTKVHFEKKWYWYFLAFELLLYVKYETPKMLLLGALLAVGTYFFFGFLYLFVLYLFSSRDYIERIIMCAFALTGLIPFSFVAKKFFDLLLDIFSG